jgi:hypothetical protein
MAETEGATMSEDYAGLVERGRALAAVLKWGDGNTVAACTATELCDALELCHQRSSIHLQDLFAQIERAEQAEASASRLSIALRASDAMCERVDALQAEVAQLRALLVRCVPELHAAMRISRDTDDLIRIGALLFVLRAALGEGRP